MKSTGKKMFFEDSISLPPASGRGIQLGNFTDGPTSGTNTNVFGWREVTVPVVAHAAGGTDPTWSQIASTAFYGYKFAKADKVWAFAQIPHDIVPNTPIHFNAHWLIDAAASPFDATAVRWEWTYAYAKGYGQEGFDFGLAISPLTTANIVTVTQVPTAVYRHMVAETTAVTIPGLTEPGGIIAYQLRRITVSVASPEVDNASGVFLLTSGIHYKSTNIATLNKSPAYYGT